MTESGTAPTPPDEDRTPTQADDAPPIKPVDQWVMPEPVFRRSSGFTPRFTGNEDPTITPDSLPTLEIDEPQVETDDPETVGETPLIAEQPEEISEAPAMSTAPPPVKRKSSFLRLLFMILGITLVALVVGAAITAVVLWYFFQVSESQNLN